MGADAIAPGAIVLFGSGETAGVGREALRWLHAAGRAPGLVVTLETPAGFEPNSEAVAARWADFLRLQPESGDAEFFQVPARHRGTRLSPDDPKLASPIPLADLILLGAGSPTYAVRQLSGSLAWRYIQAAHLLGASLFLASAAAIAAGSVALPVYEIYKVGDDPHWKDGLRLFELHGLRLAIVTHWDNADGGEELDTSRCYMGRARFDELLARLPAGVTVVGIDEHTALALEPATGTSRVLGRGGVTVLRDGTAARSDSGATVPLQALGSFSAPGSEVVDPSDLELVRARRGERDQELPSEVGELMASRERARAASDWGAADRLREQIRERGWRVEDTPDGPRLLRNGR